MMFAQWVIRITKFYEMLIQIDEDVRKETQLPEVETLIRVSSHLPTYQVNNVEDGDEQ